MFPGYAERTWFKRKGDEQWHTTLEEGNKALCGFATYDAQRGDQRVTALVCPEPFLVCQLCMVHEHLRSRR